MAVSHKAELRAMLKKAGHPASDIERVESAGDSGLGVQVVHFFDADECKKSALIDKPNLQAKAAIKIVDGWL